MAKETTQPIQHEPAGETHVTIAATIGDEFTFGDYTPGRFAWVFTNIGRLAEPIPCRGSLGLWDVPPDVAVAIERQLAVAR